MEADSRSTYTLDDAVSDSYRLNLKSILSIGGFPARPVLPVKNSVGYGILLTSFAYMLFTVHDSAIKVLVVTIPVWQILFFRSVTILAGCFIFEGPSLVGKVARSPIVKPMMLMTKACVSQVRLATSSLLQSIRCPSVRNRLK